MVETKMTAYSSRLAAYGPDGNEMRIVEDLPKAKMPHVWADSSRLMARTARETSHIYERCQGDA